MKKKLISFTMVLFCVLFCAALSVPAAAEGEAEEISASAELYSWDTDETASMTDKNESTCATIGYSGSLTVNTEKPIASLYVKFYIKSEVWTLKANGKEVDRGDDGFLHEYVDVASLVGETTELVMTFPRGASICELELYTAGTLPETVQIWEKPCEKADLVLFSSHSDDEQLFFAGVLPYSVAQGARTQVVYFCYHNENPIRLHEQLNGLWTVGVRNYPVTGAFPDLYSTSKEGGEQVFSDAGYGHEDFLEWQVENIRRFKPQVIVGHDTAGEYGHGTHIINSETLREAVELAADQDQYPYLTASYGTWDTPKVYLHLWAENEIVMDFDAPLDYFGGKSAYEVSCEGYGCHKSQHWTWFTDWLLGTDAAPITKAAQINEYSPCRYGLWRSTVGADTKADFFDNITLYSVQEELEAQKTETENTDSAAPAQSTDLSPVQNGGTDGPERRGGIPAAYIAVGAAAVAALAVLIAILVRRRKPTPPEPSRAQQQAQRLKEARDRSRADGSAPTRADIQAQRLREAREQNSHASQTKASSARPAQRPAQNGAPQRSAEQASRTETGEVRRTVPGASGSQRASGSSGEARRTVPGASGSQGASGSSGEARRPVSGGAAQGGVKPAAERKPQSPQASSDRHAKPTDKTY